MKASLRFAGESVAERRPTHRAPAPGAKTTNWLETLMRALNRVCVELGAVDGEVSCVADSTSALPSSEIALRQSGLLNTRTEQTGHQHHVMTSSSMSRRPASRPAQRRERQILTLANGHPGDPSRG